MFPNNENIDDLLLDFEEEQEKTQTFRVVALSTPKGAAILGIGKLGSLAIGSEYEYNFIIGDKCDDFEALLQNIHILMSVEADQYIIYPYTYGIHTLDLIGKPPYYVAAVLPDRIKETLLSDDRITDVTDFEFETIPGYKNKLSVKFVVRTIYGAVDGETEVNY